MTRYTDSVRTSLRDRLLDAAYGLVADAGWTGLRMAHVAERAGVSRQTVYTEFGSKDALGQALVMREVDRFLDGIREVLDEHGDDLRAGVRAGIEFTLRTAADNDLLKAVITSQRGGDGELIAHLTTRSEPLLDTATAMLGAYAAQAWPEVDAESRELAVECVVRLTVSNIVQPVAPPDQTARRIARIVTRVALLADMD
ncbi:TetR/AcrR family transcriptional regulator [Catenulispora subtropica]|uniref:TetR family transcriptional regulator n=1 Tax=Catenulispora subtropica TaxID=450798 RepID=A0ABN2RI71_9ACTN